LVTGIWVVLSAREAALMFVLFVIAILAKWAPSKSSPDKWQRTPELSA
jgi:hypothetical protein